MKIKIKKLTENIITIISFELLFCFFALFIYLEINIRFIKAFLIINIVGIIAIIIMFLLGLLFYYSDDRPYY